MESTLQHRIRERAYEIWQAHGQADGKADEHWRLAERAVLSSLRAPASDASPSHKAQKRARTGSRTGARAAKSGKMPASAPSRS